MKINIQNLLKELFSYTDVLNDSTIYSGSKSVLLAVQKEFQRLDESNDPEKQKKMINLFLGGTVYAMLQDELKYTYNLGAKAIARETWKHVQPSNEDGEIAWLFNIYAIGNHVLANLPTALTREFYTQGRKIDVNPEINLFFPPRPLGPYFPQLASNINKFDLLHLFCVEHKDNLEVLEMDTEELLVELVRNEVSNRQQSNNSGPIPRTLTRDDIYNNASATLVETTIIIPASNPAPEERSEYHDRFFSQRPAADQEVPGWDFSHPSMGMIILAACIPVIGWAYLVYVLFNALAESCCENDQENTYSL